MVNSSTPRVNSLPARVADAALEASIIGSFSRVGYLARRRLLEFEPLDSFDMSGRVVLVTGSTSGIGRAAAGQLVRMGARVLMTGRDAARTEQAADEVDACGPGTTQAYACDLSDLDAVRTTVTEITRREGRLDVVVNNAGALLSSRRESAQGNEMTLATMVLGPLVLTEGLVGLVADGGGRIVNVASGGMYTQRLALDDLQSERDYRGSVVYARAKRALVTLSEEWAQRWSDRDVVVHSMHPGWAATPGVTESLPTFNRVMGPLLRSPAEGADTIVWLAAAPEPREVTGLFWHDRTPRSTHYLPGTEPGRSERAELWDRLHDLAA